MRSLIAYLLLPNYIDPQEDEEVGVNKIPTISAISVISAERISAVKKVWVIINYFRPWWISIGDLVLEWITIAKSLCKALKKKRARELLSKLLKDTNILNIYTKEMEKCGIVGISVTLTI
jgi:hypothetical protein